MSLNPQLGMTQLGGATVHDKQQHSWLSLLLLSYWYAFSYQNHRKITDYTSAQCGLCTLTDKGDTNDSG